MKIVLLTSKTCHCVAVEQELDMLGLSYERCDIEDSLELAERFGIRHCPTLIVDDQRVIPVYENNASKIKQLLTE